MGELAGMLSGVAMAAAASRKWLSSAAASRKWLSSSAWLRKTKKKTC